MVAVGQPRLIRSEDIRPEAVVIDAGFNPGNVGDVDFDIAFTRARLITPVSGGVGPMTIAVLLAQTVEAAAHQLEIQHRSERTGARALRCAGPRWPVRVSRG